MTRPEIPTPCTKQSFQKSVVSVEVIGHCAMPNCGAHRRFALKTEQRREERAHLLHVHQRGAA